MEQFSKYVGLDVPHCLTYIATRLQPLPHITCYPSEFLSFLKTVEKEKQSA